MAKENKSIGLVILGIVAIIAVVGLVLLFTGAQTGQSYHGLDKSYGGDLKDVEFPNLEGRHVGTYPAKADGKQELAYQTGTPYRTYSREPRQIYSYVRTAD